MKQSPRAHAHGTETGLHEGGYLALQVDEIGNYGENEEENDQYLDYRPYDVVAPELIGPLPT